MRARLIAEPHQGDFAALEGYRAAAAIGVLVYHCAGATGMIVPDTVFGILLENLGGFCVAVFFVMSGFLLFRPMSSRLVRGEDPDAGPGFLLRRLLRIYPAYWLALIGWALVESAATTTRGNPWAIFLLVDAYVPPLPAYSGLSVAWTLSIEVGFYLGLAVVAPLLHALGVRRSEAARVRLQSALLVALTIGAVVFIVVTYSVEAQVAPRRWLFGYLDWFALGMLLALLSGRVEAGRQLPPRLQGAVDHGEWCLVVAALCYLAITASTNGDFLLARVDTPSGYLFRHVLQGLGAALAVAPAVLGRRDQPVLRLMRRATPASLGVVSYGIYLWHTVVLVWILERSTVDGTFGPFAIVTAVTFVATLVLAVASHRLVEVPASMLGRSSVRRDTPPAVATGV